MKSINLSSISDAITDTTDFPNMLLTGSILVTIKGNRELLIENYQGILEYTCQRIRVKSRKESVTILGEQLLIHYYTREEMKVSGIISKLEIISHI